MKSELEDRKDELERDMIRIEMDMFLLGILSIPITSFALFFGYNLDSGTNKGVMEFISFFRKMVAMEIIAEEHKNGGFLHVMLVEGKREELERMIEVYKL